MRIAMSISFGILVVLVGSLVKRYDASKQDVIFWAGIVLALVVLSVIAVIMVKISSKTKEIEEL